MTRERRLLAEDHCVVIWVQREILPLLVERLAPVRVVVFDPPDHTALLNEHPPGLLIVSEFFRGTPVAERVQVVNALLAAASPVRPLCLTPEEFRVARIAPGPVVAAVRSGVRLI